MMPTTRKNNSKQYNRDSDDKTSNKTKPKPPLSQYNLFFMVWRNRILKGVATTSPFQPISPEEVAEISRAHKNQRQLVPRRRHCKVHGQVGFVDLARAIGKRWRTLSSRDKKSLAYQARLEKEEYDLQMKQWKLDQEEKVDKRHAAGDTFTADVTPMLVDPHPREQQQGAPLSQEAVALEALSQMRDRINRELNLMMALATTMGADAGGGAPAAGVVPSVGRQPDSSPSSLYSMIGGHHESPQPPVQPQYLLPKQQVHQDPQDHKHLQQLSMISNNSPYDDDEDTLGFSSLKIVDDHGEFLPSPPPQTHTTSTLAPFRNHQQEAQAAGAYPWYHQHDPIFFLEDPSRRPMSVSSTPSPSRATAHAILEHTKILSPEEMDCLFE
mmetsp:Transcript_16857/g.34824  ORF Transcript_16857/g.34824 Transcript_16857/m.34824 type:complete len:383 (-) Transcript_16857:804-1952(-)